MAAGPMDRLVVAVLEGVGRRLWGFPPNLMAPIVGEFGPLRAPGWFLANMPRYERTLKAFGGLRTHLLAVAISLVNGCRYCTYGHGYALELIYFRDHGALFPLGAKELDELVGRPEAVIRRQLVDALEEARQHTEVAPLDRAFALHAGGLPTERADLRIAHLVRMFGVLNSVGIASQAPPDQAHDPLNKNLVLKHCHELLRAEI